MSLIRENFSNMRSFFLDVGTKSVEANKQFLKYLVLSLSVDKMQLGQDKILVTQDIR